MALSLGPAYALPALPIALGAAVLLLAVFACGCAVGCSLGFAAGALGPSAVASGAQKLAVALSDDTGRGGLRRRPAALPARW